MTDEELEAARAWAETAEPYPVKRGFLTLLEEIDRLRPSSDTDDLAELLAEVIRQRDKLIHRVRELENRANLVAGLGQHHPAMHDHFRAAVFILTGEWPPDHPRKDQT